MSKRQAQAFSPTRLASSKPARPQRAARQAGARVNCCQPWAQRRAMRPPLEIARSNCASSQSVRPLANKPCATGWISTARPSNCSANSATAGSASSGAASKSCAPVPSKTGAALRGTQVTPCVSTSAIHASSTVPLTTRRGCAASAWAGENSGTTRVAGRRACSKNCNAARSHGLSHTATSATPSGPRCGPSANARPAGSSSRRSSSTPSSAARMRPGDIGGNFTSCQDKARAGTTSTSASARGNKASGTTPWSSASCPSSDSA